MKFCTNCGSQIPDEDIFCTSCGARQQDTEPHEMPPTAHGNEARCPCCGTVIVGDDLFCTNCGARLTPMVVENVSSLQPNTIEDVDNHSIASENICPRCGASVAKDEVFCTNCGVRLKDPESVAAPTEKEIKEDDSPVSTVSQADNHDAEVASEKVSTEDSPDEKEEQEEKKPESKGSSSCMGCLILLVLIGVMGYFAWSSGYLGSTSESDYVDEENTVKEFIVNMYNNHSYEEYRFLEDHCTRHLLDVLRADYEYDGTGYAVWDFRTCSQDGKLESESGNENKIISVESLGDGWYTYEFYDGGWRGKKRVKASVVDGEVMMDVLETLYDECEESFNAEISNDWNLSGYMENDSTGYVN